MSRAEPTPLEAVGRTSEGECVYDALWVPGSRQFLAAVRDHPVVLCDETGRRLASFASETEFDDIVAPTSLAIKPGSTQCARTKECVISETHPCRNTDSTAATRTPCACST